MTSFEQTQNRDVFAHAGQLAYNLGGVKPNNPYPANSSAAKSWEFGYSRALAMAPKPKVRQPFKKRTPYVAAGAQRAR
jgi:hypothetical protein